MESEKYGRIFTYNKISKSFSPYGISGKSRITTTTVKLTIEELEAKKAAEIEKAKEQDSSYICHESSLKDVQNSLKKKNVLVIRLLEFALDAAFNNTVTYLTDKESYRDSFSELVEGDSKVILFNDWKKLDKKIEELNMKFDAIIMNPPYGIWAKCLEKASKYVTDDGELVCLSPSAPLVQSTISGERYRNVLNRVSCYDFEMVSFSDNFKTVDNGVRDDLGLYYCNKSKQTSKLFTEDYDILNEFEHSFLDLMRSDWCRTHMFGRMEKVTIKKFIPKIDLNKWYFYCKGILGSSVKINLLSGDSIERGIMSGSVFKKDLESYPRLIGAVHSKSKEELESIFTLFQTSVILNWSILVHMVSARSVDYSTLRYFPNIDYTGCNTDEELLKRIGYKGNPQDVINYIKTNFPTNTDWFKEVQRRVLERK